MRRVDTFWSFMRVFAGAAFWHGTGLRGVAISTALTARFSARGESLASALAPWRANRPDWLPPHCREAERYFEGGLV
ncbi:MAG: hypothetical protein ABSH27_08515 [Solirubrobacteraceae bacterium]